MPRPVLIRALAPLAGLDLMEQRPLGLARHEARSLQRARASCLLGPGDRRFLRRRRPGAGRPRRCDRRRRRGTACSAGVGREGRTQPWDRPAVALVGARRTPRVRSIALSRNARCERRPRPGTSTRNALWLARRRRPGPGRSSWHDMSMEWLVEGDDCLAPSGAISGPRWVRSRPRGAAARSRISAAAAAGVPGRTCRRSVA